MAMQIHYLLLFLALLGLHLGMLGKNSATTANTFLFGRTQRRVKLLLLCQGSERKDVPGVR